MPVGEETANIWDDCGSPVSALCVELLELQTIGHQFFEDACGSGCVKTSLVRCLGETEIQKNKGH